MLPPAGSDGDLAHYRVGGLHACMHDCAIYWSQYIDAQYTGAGSLRNTLGMHDFSFQMRQIKPNSTVLRHFQ